MLQTAEVDPEILDAMNNHGQNEAPEVDTTYRAEVAKILAMSVSNGVNKTLALLKIGYLRRIEVYQIIAKLHEKCGVRDLVVTGQYVNHLMGRPNMVFTMRDALREDPIWREYAEMIH